MKDSDDTVISTEDFTHDAAGNITGAPDSCFQYDINNRLTMYNCQAVSYDMDGNMLSCKLDGKTVSFAYDSANRLISAGGHTYTYNAEDVRIRNLCTDADTTYTYNTNCKLSQLLMKTTSGVETKYVYGCGLIGEEVNNAFKTYHFDCRGSTIAITDANGSITDTFRYDTYGKLIERTGESVVIFGYNGCDGVVTDKNGLVYMRARYYSPETRRFVNADIVAGDISNAVTLNRFVYANGNPVSFVDPFGLSGDNRGSIVYDGKAYDIFVPTYSSKDSMDGWKQIAVINDTITDDSFDLNQFIADLVMNTDDMDDIATGQNPNFNQNFSGIVAIYSLGINLLSAIGNNRKQNDVHINYEFQENNGQRRVIITLGTSEQSQLMSKYAGNSVYATSKCNSMGEVVRMSNCIDDLYTLATGKDTNWWKIYNLRITIDKKHRNSKEFSYVWPNEEGKLMISPIVYADDKIELGTGYFIFSPEVSLPITGIAAISDELNKKINSSLDNNDLVLN